MSLINEALKKARQEAAQQEAVRRGLPAAKAPAFTPRRGRRMPQIVAAVAGLLLAAAGGAWLAQRAPGDPQAAAVPPEPAVTVASPSPEAPPPGQPVRAEELELTAGAIPAAAIPAAADSPAAAASARPSTSPPAAREPAPPPAPGLATDPEPPAAETSAPPNPTVRQPTTPATSSRQATLPDGSTLRLDGIAWSEISPSAVLNGQLVGRGERVAGALVLRIERDRVVVDAGGRELTIRLR